MLAEIDLKPHSTRAWEGQPVSRGSAYPPGASVQPLRLLAYVHLRNIYRSTGAGRVARQLVEHLALRSDIDLEVLADARDHARILPSVGEPWSNFSYHLFDRETSRQQLLWYSTGFPVATRFRPEAEVVFCTGESYVPKGRARLAVTAHDAAYFEQTAHRQDRAFVMQRLKWRLLFRRLSRRADLIHTVSEFSRDRLAHFFPDLASRIRVIPNAVTPHFFEPVREAGLLYLRQEGLEGRRYLLIPGGLHFRKNADLILAVLPRLLQQIPDLLVCIVNHSDPSYAVRALAFGPRIRMLGFVSDPALHALYRCAAAVWFPSLYEGFGMPVLESMATGTAVVTSDASSLPEVAGGAALLADPHSPSSHLDQLLAVLTDDDLRERCAAAGRQRAAYFTWERSAAQLAGFLQELR